MATKKKAKASSQAPAGAKAGAARAVQAAAKGAGKAPAKAQAKAGAKAQAKAQSAGEAPAKAPAQAPQAAPAGRSKMWMVPVVMLLVLAGVAVFLVHHARYLASLKFDMVREARTVPQGHDRGQATGLANLTGDKAGHVFVLESQPDSPVRLQRFDAQDSPDTLVYSDEGGHDLNGAEDVDCDPSGTVYVLLKDGRIQVLDNDLKYLRTVATGIQGGTALSVNSEGRIFVADKPDNKVVYFNAKGLREGEFGAPGAGNFHLVAPSFLRVAPNDEVLVIETTEASYRGRIIAKDLSLRKTFLLDKVQPAPPVRLGINAQDKAFVNDPGGTSGIVCYDLANGTYFGSAQATKDGEQFVAPGCIGADRYTNSVYVHTVTGLIKCELPGPGDAEEAK